MYAWMTREEEEEEEEEEEGPADGAASPGGIRVRVNDCVPWFTMASERFQERFEGGRLVCAFTPASSSPVAFVVGKKDDANAIDAIGVRRGWRRMGVARTVAQYYCAQAVNAAAEAKIASAEAAAEAKRSAQQRVVEARARLVARAEVREKRLQAQAQEAGEFWSKSTARRLLAALDSDSDSSSDEDGGDPGGRSSGNINAERPTVYRVDALPGSVRFWRALGFTFDKSGETKGGGDEMGSSGGGGDDRPMMKVLGQECVDDVDQLVQDGALLADNA